MEANPFMAKDIQDARAFDLPVIDDRLVYTGENYAKKEAEGGEGHFKGTWS